MTNPNPPVVRDPEPPIPDPGLGEHQWRPTDVDERSERRAERQVALMFGLSAIFTILFVVAYFAFSIGEDWDTFAGYGLSNMALGLTLGMSLLLIGVGIIHWARKLMADQEIVEERHPAASSDEDRTAVLGILATGAEESGIGRRPLVRNSLLGAVALLGLPAVVVLRDLHPGKLDIKVLERTVWEEGMRVVRDVVGTPIRPGDLKVGDLVNAEPEVLVEPAEPREDVEYLHGHEILTEKAKAAVILLRMRPDDIIPGPGRDDWSIDGIVCYSKICTHVGCPISLNERTTHHLLCPCHQSTFDLADSGKVVFGPAARALPQLPLAVDSEGYLVAQRDFTEPVGPSYWERNSPAYYEENPL